MSTRPDDYTVLWLCAAQVFEVAKRLLDRVDSEFKTKVLEPDSYFYGKVGRHNIIVLLLPTALSKYEYSTAATPQNGERAIERIVQDFPEIRIALAVGVGGGAPTQKNDIRLGDAVIALAKGTHKGVFPYNIGKTIKSRRFESIEPPSSTEQLSKSNIVIPEVDQSCSNVYERDLAQLVQRREQDGWECYAAAIAFFSAKELLRLIPPGAFDLQRVQKPSRFFRMGRCFITRWVEPMSSRLEDQSATDTTRTTDPYGGAFTKMRRFIVIREGYHCSWCVPIHTYQGRGTTKPDIKLHDHAKMYRIGNTEVEAEFPLRKPIGIVIEGESELHQLHPASLVNFGKIHTIEHDISVMNIGYVPKSQVACLKLDLNALEKSSRDMKYQKLRRDEGPFNIQLEGNEKLSIQELDIGTEGLVSMAMTGESYAKVHKLKGSYGSLRIAITDRATLELDTVAVNGTISISLTGESKVVIKELQEYSGTLLATISGKAKLTMIDVKLKGGLVALAMSDKSQLIFRTLHGQGEFLSAKASGEAELRIQRAYFVDSQININMCGGSQFFMEFLRTNDCSFITELSERARVQIDKTESMKSTASRKRLMAKRC
ncbi:hypothetical protein F4678DRAFT_448711 [Xylaria arbuscula]|nr:hypothetical protein F4678DRAFT_448711 [Xylaria arbuscula]